MSMIYKYSNSEDVQIPSGWKFANTINKEPESNRMVCLIYDMFNDAKREIELLSPTHTTKGSQELNTLYKRLKKSITLLCHFVLHQSIYLNDYVLELLKTLTLKDLSQMDKTPKDASRYVLGDLPHLFKVVEPHAICFPGHYYVVDEESRIYDPEKCDFISVDNLIAKGETLDDEELYPSINSVHEFKKYWEIKTKDNKVIPVDLMTLLMLESIFKYVDRLKPNSISKLVKVEQTRPVDSKNVTAFHKTTRVRMKDAGYGNSFHSIGMFLDYLNNVNLYEKSYTDISNVNSGNCVPKTIANPMYAFICRAVDKHKVGEASSGSEKINLLSCYGNKNPNFIEHRRSLLPVAEFIKYVPYWAEILYIRGRQKVITQKPLSVKEWEVVANWMDYKSLSDSVRRDEGIARFDDLMIQSHDSFMDINPVSGWISEKKSSEILKKPV
jgi:hypothetical protein